MKAKIFTTHQVLAIILLALSVTLLFLALWQVAQNPLTSVGWHELASVSWNG